MTNAEWFDNLTDRIDKLSTQFLTDTQRSTIEICRHVLLIELNRNPENATPRENELAEKGFYLKIIDREIGGIERSLKNRAKIARRLRYTLITALSLPLFGLILIGDLIKGGLLDGLFSFAYEVSLYLFGKFVMLVLVASLGYRLYVFREKQRLYYGAVETLFAMVSCYFVIDNLKVEHDQKHSLTSHLLIAGMSSLYLLVRGLSNIAEGWEKSFVGKERLQKLSIKYFGKQEVE